MVKTTPQKSPKTFKNKTPKTVKSPISKSMKEQRTPEAMTPKLVKTPKAVKTPLLQSLKEQKTPKAMTPKLVKAPKTLKSPISKRMKEQKTPKAMTPKLVKTPKAMTPKLVKTSKAMTPKLVKTPKAMTPKLVKTPKAVTPKLVKTPKAMTPKLVKTPKAVKTPISQSMKEQRTPKARSPKLVKIPKVLKTPAPVTPEIMKKTPGTDENKLEKKKLMRKAHSAKKHGTELNIGGNDKKKNGLKQISLKRKRGDSDDNDAPAAKRIPSDYSKQVYVGQLSKDSTKKSVTNYFSKFGAVSSCFLPRAKSRKSKKYAYVSFLDQRTRRRVLKKKHTIDNEEVIVQKCIQNNALLKPKISRDCQLMISNLDVSLDEECIKKYFSKYGDITMVTVPKGVSDGIANKGFGFVSFSTKDEMNAVINAGPHDLANKQITCTPVSYKKKKLGENLKYDMENQVLVSGLPTDVTHADLQKHFEAFGPIRYVNHQNKMKSIAYIVFVNPDGVEAALKIKHEICGKLVKCTSASKLKTFIRTAPAVEMDVSMEASD